MLRAEVYARVMLSDQKRVTQSATFVALRLPAHQNKLLVNITAMSNYVL
jgi:hypothetical protein